MTNEQSQHPIAVIGSGPAGLAAANTLLALGHHPVIIEKKKNIGGKLARWHNLFPGFISAAELQQQLIRPLEEASVKIITETEVQNLKNGETGLEIKTASGEKITVKGVVWASGYTEFDAHRKEEYGYGLYKNVLTSADVEEMLTKEGRLPFSSEEVKRIGILHCVGSRDEKAGNTYCSKVCCICAVKQAIEMKKLYPGAEVFNFYMDLRLFGKGYEELYREAQIDWRVNFIRGRVSELAEDMQGKIRMKTEDTLTGTPMKMTLDFVILMVGMEGKQFPFLSEKKNADGSEFIDYAENFTGENQTMLPNVMIAGACKGPSTVTDAINDGKSAALALHQYLTIQPEQ
ncbi:MAG: FAD-dependent oxidoreductase [Prolixibacteraceae bacterium]|jgi:heterodisulfide reductase subunit A|nr:FAD-dependent oxidoreductase [Prolixibacteraceae bacterium]